MTLETGIRTQIAVLIYSMTNSVMFGAGLIVVLMVPTLNADAGFWISISRKSVANSRGVSAPIQRRQIGARPLGIDTDG